MHALRLAVVLVAFLMIVAPGGAEAGGKGWDAHPPMRPAHKPMDRPMADGPGYFVDVEHGDDENDGSRDAPWRTLAHGALQLQPGDTLYLREGVYYETLVLDVRGAPGAPITIRAYPGEHVVVDGSYREFHENPQEAWEPYPQGAPGEYRSTRAYPELARRDDALPRRNVFVMGNFAESMVPLHGYHTLLDLRAEDSWWRNLPEKHSKAGGVYAGPGVWLDVLATANHRLGSLRIHIRLAHTDFEALDELDEADNYRGETDPRKLPLIIAGPDTVIDVNTARHLRLQDMVVRGSRNATMRLHDAEDIELEHMTVYGGAPALDLRQSRGVTITHCAFRGVSAPWSNRASEKYRGASTYLLTAYKRDDEPQTENLHISYSEFSDCHDGLYLWGVRDLVFHNNYVDNFNDDGLEVGPMKRTGEFVFHSNRLSRSLMMFTLHQHRRQAYEGDDADSRVYVFRNVIDLRQPVNGGFPSSPEDTSLHRDSRLFGDHGGPIWPNYIFYHNTILVPDSVWRGHYGASSIRAAARGGGRQIFNNIFFHVDGMPGTNFSHGGPGSEPARDGNFTFDGNLHWSHAHGRDHEGDFFADFRASNIFEQSREHYGPGWASNDVFADPSFVSFTPDHREVDDLRLGEGSPAIGAGVSVPQERGWPDVMPTSQTTRPDIGAVPYGEEPWRVGVHGRFSVFGPTDEPTYTER